MAAVMAALNLEGHNMTTQSPPEAVSLAANGTQLSSAVLAAAVLTMGLMAGVFGLYTHTIMPGLRRTDDRTFVGAFQSMDKAIINPWFMAAFLGALILGSRPTDQHLGPDINAHDTAPRAPGGPS
jgi:hypothetical protein